MKKTLNVRNPKIIRILITGALLILMYQFVSCTKEIDYIAVSEKLNEGDLSKIMNANEDQYVYFYSNSDIFTNDSIKNSLKEEIHGSLNINNKIAYGKVKKSLQNKVNDSILKNETFTTNIKYENDVFVCKNNEKLFSMLLFGKLQGLQNIKPVAYTYGLDVPPSLFYRLNQKEFEKILNNNLHIKYYKFKDATILFDFDYRTGKEPKQIREISIWIDYEIKNEANKNIRVYQSYDLIISTKQTNKKAKKDFNYYKVLFEKN